MDPIAQIIPAKDTTLGLLEAGQRRGWGLLYFEPKDLLLEGGRVYGYGRQISVDLDLTSGYRFDSPVCRIPLDRLGAVLMRVDPPVDEAYLNTCHLLEFVESRGGLVVNSPKSLRLCNEKIFAQRFTKWSPTTLVSKNPDHLLAFAEEHQDTVIKPLNQMGGVGVQRLHQESNLWKKTLDQATNKGHCHILIQTTIKNHQKGDKRILLINGVPVEKAMLRVPPKGGFHANLAAGGTAVGADLEQREREICADLAPILREMDLLFVGIDVIDGYLTEINVTSPTCMRHLNKFYSMDIGIDVIKAIEAKIQTCKKQTIGV